jgi:hypothetical protein
MVLSSIAFLSKKPPVRAAFQYCFLPLSGELANLMGNLVVAV